MGMSLKRVPLDFNWPMNQVWKGYINPYHPIQCKSCEGSGRNPKTKEVCQYCDGEGVLWQSDEIRSLYENWEEFEPPTGEGHQLWETISEGSPISQVFKTLDELCEWCEKNAMMAVKYKATKDQWKSMLTDDLVYYQEGNIIVL